ncbi:rho GDP-dissociation inhibitor [Streptacidiphilus sp. PAMC 29251]
MREDIARQLAEEKEAMPKDDRNDDPGTGSGTISLLTLTLQVEGRPSRTWQLDDPEVLTEMKTKALVLAESCHYRIVIGFRADGGSVLGTKYTTNHYRKGLRVDKDQLMLGSFSPRDNPQSVTIPRHYWDEAPSGMLNRGHYNVKTVFHDDDNKLVAELEYAVDITHDWPAA